MGYEDMWIWRDRLSTRREFIIACLQNSVFVLSAVTVAFWLCSIQGGTECYRPFSETEQEWQQSKRTREGGTGRGEGGAFRGWEMALLLPSVSLVRPVCIKWTAHLSHTFSSQLRKCVKAVDPACFKISARIWWFFVIFPWPSEMVVARETTSGLWNGWWCCRYTCEASHQQTAANPPLDHTTRHERIQWCTGSS